MRRLASPFFLCVLAACSGPDRRMDQYATLVTKLGSYDDEERNAAIRKIRGGPPVETKAALRAILKGEVLGNWNERVLVSVAAILTTWEDEQTGEVDTTGLPELIEALRGPDDSLRRIAAEVLPLQGIAAVPLVKDVLTSGQRPNRMDAAVILGRMLGRNQEPAAGQALADVSLADEESPEVRMAIVINLAEWKNEEAAKGFLNGLTDPDEQVRTFSWLQIKKRLKPPYDFNPREDFAVRGESIRLLRAWWKEREKKKGKG
jgi:hypothetical protein